MKLEGNTILITGGSAGIGLALAEEFLAHDNKVIITGRNPSKLDAARQKNPGLEIFQCDVADPIAIQKTADAINSQFPELNVLINNAGVFDFINVAYPSKDLVAMMRELDINVAGPIRTTSVFVETLKKNQGTIINVTSGLAFVPIQCGPIYCATKAALHSYTISLRQQLADFGVEVIELAPPGVHTDLTADLPKDGDFKMLTTEELVTATFNGLKAGKTLITPGEAAQLRFMSRLAPGFIEGQLAKGSKPLVPSAS